MTRKRKPGTTTAKRRATASEAAVRRPSAEPPTTPTPTGRAPIDAQEADALRWRLVRKIIQIRCRDVAACGQAICRRSGVCRNLNKHDARVKLEPTRS